MSENLFEPWSASPRADQILDLNQAQEQGRLQWLLPLRRQRMAASAFSFFRGAAAQMARDLAQQTNSGEELQLCGDAHLMNFGFYASPERTLLFDLNDFDETHPGPFEWDLKRLAVSAVLAAREMGLKEEEQQTAVKTLAKHYRNCIARYGERNRLEAWYARLDAEAFIRGISNKHFRNYLETVAQQARGRDSLSSVRRLCEGEGPSRRFRNDPPTLQTLEVADNWQPSLYNGYLNTLRVEVRALLQHFKVVDQALKVVGVGSVGRRCGLALLQGEHPNDVIVLQVKEAVASVLARGESERHQGQRVVGGQRLMQSASDPFLGWASTSDGGHCYWRQFRDWKGSVNLTALDECCLNNYVKLCAEALAKSHARSGNPAAINELLGSIPRYPSQLASYALSYAQQTVLDHQVFAQAFA